MSAGYLKRAGVISTAWLTAVDALRHKLLLTEHCVVEHAHAL